MKKDGLSELDAAKMEMEEVINDYPKKDYSPQIIGKLPVEKSEGEEAVKMPKEFTDWYNNSQDAFMEAKFNMAEIAYAAWQRGRAGK